MAHTLRGFFLASLVSVSVLALGACSTTGANMSNTADANRVDSILERAAREAKASGNKVEMLALLEKIYQRNPDDAAVATGYGQALREDEQLNQARQILYPFTEGKNAYPDAVTELAMVQLALGQYKEAELTARRSIELDDEQGRGYLALGTALDAQNAHEEAETAFRDGLDRWKGDPAPILNNLALNLASQNKLDQAIDMLNKAREVSPGRVEIERNLRIISTLKETADEFLIKEEQKKKAAAIAAAKPTPAPVPAPAPKKEAVKSEEKPAATKSAKTDPSPKPVTKKSFSSSKNRKEAVKTETVKKEPVKKETEAAAKVEPAAAPTPINVAPAKKTRNFSSKQPQSD